MNIFDQSNFATRSKFRVRGKWELVLVLVVVLAGIAVTVVAVLKAKEKRDSYEDGAEGRMSVIDSNPGLQNSRHIKLSSIPISYEPNMMTRKPLLGNRYQAEQEFAETAGINTKVSHSKHTHRLVGGKPGEQVRSEPTKLRIDGLPAYPPPVNIDPNYPWINEKQSPGSPLLHSAGYALDELEALASHEVPDPVAPRPHSAEAHSRNQNPARFHKTNHVPANVSPIQYNNIFKQHGFENGNYISTRELMWLQRTRPELFQSGSIGGQAVMPHRIARVRRNAPGKRRKKQLVDEENEVNRRYLEFDDQPLHQSGRRKSNKHGNRYSDPEHRRPSKKKLPKKYSRKLEKSKNRYSKEESKNVEKLDILGSGNFEIIRGGILDKYDDRKELQKSSNVVPNDKVNDGPGINESEEDEEDKSPDLPNNNHNSPDTFEPFNFDIFKNDPLFSGFG